MKQILNRTVERTLRPLLLIIAVGVGVLIGRMICSTARITNVPAYDTIFDEALAYQNLGVFFAITGILLMLMICAHSSGIIANEVHEGTLRLLAAKPNSRTTILFAKIMGCTISYILILAASLLTCATYISVWGLFDGNLKMDLLMYYPAYMLYGLFVAFFFSSLTTFLSCISKRKIIALLPMIFLTMIMLGAFPLLRLILTETASGTYEGKMMYLYDFNYHFALIFEFIVSKFGEMYITPDHYSMYRPLMGLFTQRWGDGDIYLNDYYRIITHADYLKPTFLFAVYGGLGVLNYMASFIVIRRKDV